MILDFWSGLTRANTVVWLIAAVRASSSSRSSSAPVWTCSTSRPMSRQTLPRRWGCRR
jgi:hypothetical protein